MVGLPKRSVSWTLGFGLKTELTTPPKGCCRMIRSSGVAGITLKRAELVKKTPEEKARK